MPNEPIAALARSYFHAFQNGDRAAMEALLAPDFTFISPFDDHIDRAAYFTRCWPSNGAFRFRDDMKIFAEGEECFVLYSTEGKTGGTFRNTEFFRFEGGRVRSIDVFFGFLPEGMINKP